MTIDPGRSFLRNPAATALTSAGRVVFVLPGEVPQHADAVDAAALAATWEVLASPVSGSDLQARIAGVPRLAELIEALIMRAFILRGAAGEFESWRPAHGSPPGGRPCRQLVVGVTGAVQAAFVPQQLRRLAVEFADQIDVILSRAALEFVQARAIATLGAKVWSDPFEQRGDSVVPPHIHLASRAEMVLVLPATADAIFRLAHGAASDLLSLVVCATEAPIVVVPSMNATMWRHAAVQRNVETLRRDGAFVVEPGVGWSVADPGERQVGAAGLGADGNLAGALEAVLGLSRRRSPPPSPRPPVS